MHLLIQQRLKSPSTDFVNILARIEIPMGKLKYSVANEPQPQLKCGRPIDSKDTIPRKRKSVKFNAHEENAPEEHRNVKGLNDELTTHAKASIEQLSHEIVSMHNNEEISINYIHKGNIWDRNTILIDDAFSFQGAMDIISNDEDQEPQNMNECRHRNDWLKPVGYRWIFV